MENKPLVKFMRNHSGGVFFISSLEKISMISLISFRFVGV